MVMTKVYKELPLRESEILRYAGCRTGDMQIVSLMHTCLQEAEEAQILNGQLCYLKLPYAEKEVLCGQNACVEPMPVAGKSVCDFDSFFVNSEQLARNLSGCNSVLLLAATAGVGIDRLIGKYGRIAPSKALMFQAIGTELVEMVCDMFCKEYEKMHNCILRPRFSPGYGDLPLETQKDIFSVLDCAKRIGLTLNDSLLMSPSKSVTAFAGIAECDAGKLRDVKRI